MLIGGKLLQLDGGYEGEPYSVGAEVEVLSVSGQPFPLSGATSPVYERSTNCVYFVDGASVVQLDSANKARIVAGKPDESGAEDGAGPAARFKSIHEMATDDDGSIFVAQADRIRRLEVVPPEDIEAKGLYARVTTVVREPPAGYWTAITYDPVTGALLAATSRCLYRIPAQPDSSSPSSIWLPHRVSGGRLADSPRDGDEADACFVCIVAMLQSAAGRTYILDEGHLRVMDERQRVRTLLPLLPKIPTCMAILPSGCLAVSGVNAKPKLHLLGDGLTPCGGAGAGSVGPTRGHALPLGPRGAVQSRHLRVPAVAGLDAHGGTNTTNSSDGGGGAAHSCSGGRAAAAAARSAVLTIRAGGHSFVAHRALLADRSDYFRQLLEGGFAEGGAAEAEVELRDADPEALGALLEYMYTGTLAVPSGLLRPTAELAGRLLLPGVAEQLAAPLLAACSVRTAVSDLLWAERHSLSELVTQFKRFTLRHVKEIAAANPDAMRELAAGSPGLAAEVLLAVVGKL